MDVQFSLHRLLKRLFFPLFNCLAVLVKNQSTVMLWVYFWTPDSITLTCVSPVLALHRPYCNFVVTFKIRLPSNSVIVFQDCFAYSGTLMNLRISFSISAKQPIGISRSLTLDLYNGWGTIGVLTILSLLEHECRRPSVYVEPI